MDAAGASVAWLVSGTAAIGGCGGRGTNHALGDVGAAVLGDNLDTGERRGTAVAIADLLI
jgi:hypothetical protein